MNPYIYSAIAGLLGLGIGCAAVALLLRSQTKQAQDAMEEAQKHALDVDQNIATRTRELEVESRDRVQQEVAKLRETIETETADRRRELKEGEKRLRDREAQLDRRVKNLDAKEKNLGTREAEIQKRIEDADEVLLEQKKEVERVG